MEARYPIDAFHHHRLHVVGQNRQSYAAKEIEGMHHAVQQRLDVLALRELDILHPRPAQRQRKSVQPLAIPVAEMAPVHLRLFARRSLETHKRPLPALAPPRTHDLLHLRQAAIVAALPDLQEQSAGVVHALLPTLPQIGPPGIGLPTLRLAFVLPRGLLGLATNLGPAVAINSGPPVAVR